MLFSANEFVAICHTAVEEECIQGSIPVFGILLHSKFQFLTRPQKAAKTMTAPEQIHIV